MNTFFYHNKLYRKYVLGLIISIIVSISTLTFFSTAYYTQITMSNLTNTNRLLYDEKKNIFEDRLEALDATIYSLIGNKEIRDLLLLSGDEDLSSIEYLSIIQLFRSIVDGTNVIDGIVLYDHENEVIVSDITKYEAPNPDHFLGSDDNSLQLTKDQKDGNYILSRTFKAINTDKNFTLALFLNPGEFEKNITFSTSDNYVVIKNNHDTIYSNSQFLDLYGNFSSIYNDDELHYETESSQRLMIFDEPTIFTNISYIMVSDYTSVYALSNRVSYLIVVVGIGFLILTSLTLISINSYYRNPLKKLRNSISKDGTVNHAQNTQDDYKVIEDAFEKLQDKQNTTDANYKKAIPIVIGRTLLQLINEPFEQKKYNYLLELSGNSMEHKLFYLILIRGFSKQKISELALDINTFITENIECETILTMDTGKNCNYIILANTNLKLDAFEEMLRHEQTHISSDFSRSIWCLSNEFDDISVISTIYYGAVQLLQHATFEGNRSFVSPKTDFMRFHQSGTYCHDGIHVAQLLLNHKKEEAMESITKTVNYTLKSSNDTLWIKQQIYIIVIQLLSTLSDNGHLILSEYSKEDIFRSFSNASNVSQIRELVEEIMSESIYALENNKTNVYSVSIYGAIVFIENNYPNNISLDDVANSVFLSSGYLSSLFKNETGFTVYEYITNTRMAEAKKLLKTSDNKIAEISEKVGYNNVQSFIRFFKKYYAITPAEYRNRYNNPPGKNK